MSVTNTQNPVALEPASQALVEATVGPPFLHELSPAEARAVLDELQGAPIDKLPVNDRWTTVPADVGDVRVRIVRPPNAVGTLFCRSPPIEPPAMQDGCGIPSTDEVRGERASV
jgi:acetyl esterase